jgi:hypothetical protein
MWTYPVAPCVDLDSLNRVPLRPRIENGPIQRLIRNIKTFRQENALSR